MLRLTFFSLLAALAVRGLYAAVSPTEMQALYDTVKTPYKHGVILSPAKGHMLDNPTVFRHADKWYMLYIDFDGKGYETHLAVSDDLLRWQPLGCTFRRGGPDAWDRAQADGWPILLDPDWNGSNTLGRFENRYGMMYIGGAKGGYETPPLAEGIAWSDDPTRLGGWVRDARNPVLSPSDPDARPFEKLTIFKSFVIEDPTRRCGGRFALYYNAAQQGKWVERIGMAVSDDLRRWRRVGSGPCVCNTGALDNGICGDPMVRRIGETYVMFFFGFKWEDKPGAKAFDTFAASKDLMHWTRWNGPKLVEPSEPWDAVHAHKPWVIFHSGVVYHFYCAVGSQGRVLALATSKPLGSALR